MSVAVDLFTNDTMTYSSEKSEKWEQDIDRPYCKVYQLRLSEVANYNRYRREQQARMHRDRYNIKQSIDFRLHEQQVHKEYMKQMRERTKAQVQEVVATYKKKRQDFAIKAKQTVTLSIVSSNISPSLEPRSKCISKTKLPPLPIKSESVPSPALSLEKSVKKPKLTPIPKLEESDDLTASTMNKFSFTEATSSARFQRNKRHYNARQSILDAIMVHLNSYKPSDEGKGPTYEDFKYKFASSISPHVYTTFERLVV